MHRQCQESEAPALRGAQMKRCSKFNFCAPLSIAVASTLPNNPVCLSVCVAGCQCHQLLQVPRLVPAGHVQAAGVLLVWAGRYQLRKNQQLHAATALTVTPLKTVQVVP